MSRDAHTRPERLFFTGDEEADRLIADDPVALMIGFCLDQQVTVQKAFSGPLELLRRLGHLDPARIAAEDPARLAAIFRERPALHRYPASMAARVQALCAYLDDRYDGDAARIWEEATSGADLRARLEAVPGIGKLKVTSLLTLLARQYGVKLPGLAAELPEHPTLGAVTSAEELAEYQAGKRAHKAALRAARAQ
jgi:uncharacterized HhH-GPD family protein